MIEDTWYEILLSKAASHMIDVIDHWKENMKFCIFIFSHLKVSPPAREIWSDGREVLSKDFNTSQTRKDSN